jgi:hypothetical protein
LASCAPRRAPTFAFWNHTKARFEHWFTYVQPDAPPLGQSLYQAMTTQIDNGVAVRMILNDFDFEPNSANLNRRGLEKLPHLAELAFRYPYSIVVERPDYNPALGMRRVETTRKELVRMAIPLQLERIVEGGPLTRGLDGSAMLPGGGSVGAGSGASGSGAGDTSWVTLLGLGWSRWPRRR